MAPMSYSHEIPSSVPEVLVPVTLAHFDPFEKPQPPFGPM